MIVVVFERLPQPQFHIADDLLSKNSEAAVAESMPNNPVEPEVDDGDRDNDNGSESSSGSEDGE